MTRNHATTACLLLACGAFAQQPRPSFEVASVKLAAPLAPHESIIGQPVTGPGTSDPTRIRFRRVPLSAIIWQAYGLRGNQISGPPWIQGRGASEYDVEAKVPLGASPQDLKLMLRGLLEERFHLQFHKEMREVSGWELVVAKTGFKANESSLTAEAAMKTGKMMTSGPVPGGIRLRGVGGISALASALEYRLNRAPVIDKTELSGNYEFDFEFAPIDNPAQQDVTLPSLWTVLQQDVGLQLLRQKLQLEFMVIDHVDRVPTEN